MSRTLATPRRVDIVGVPMDLGASRRGVDMGPSAVRYARLHDKLQRLGIETIADHGNLAVPIRESASIDDAAAKYFDVIQIVCEQLAGVVETAVRVRTAGGSGMDRRARRHQQSAKFVDR